MSKIVLKIYIAGLCKRNADTIANCKTACATSLAAQTYKVQVIDILQNPSIAESNKILATPTIVRETTAAEKRIIGELKDVEKAKKALEFLTSDL